jgi:hypothetical protein
MHVTVLVLALVLSPAALAQAPTPAGAGPYPARIIADPTLPTHTIYSPAELGDQQLPVVVWGNGGCVNSNYEYREFLAEIASWGFLVVAVGPYRETPLPPPERSGAPEEWPPFQTSSGQMIDGINWALSVADREDSRYAGHVDTRNIAVMGHSCGGLQALEASYDRRVTTVLVLNSGLFDDGDPYMQRFSVDRSMLPGLRVPTGYFIGGEGDVAYANAMKDWPLLEVASVMANLDVGHGATYQMPGGGPFAAAPLAWLRWQLQGDMEAAGVFRGPDCGLCDHPEWKLEKRAID